MLQPIFPTEKPRTDYIIFALGIIACFVCYALREYSYFQPLTPDIRSRLSIVSDSVLAEDGISHDSASVFVEPSIDNDALGLIKRTKGVDARTYIDTSDTQLFLVRMKIERKGATNVINFSGNRPRSGVSAGGMDGSKDFIRVIWLNKVGGIVGAMRHIHDTIPSDTITLKQTLNSILPEEYSTLPLTVQVDSSNSEITRCIANISRNDLFAKDILLAARKISTKPAIWSVEWQIRVTPLTNYDQTKQANPILDYLQYAFWTIVAITIIGLFVVALQRQRIKALDMGILFLPILTGLGFVITQASIGNFPWFTMVAIFLVYTLGYGFFFIAAPIAATVSVLRESVSEKFYTTKRWISKPWQSFHWGRMILIGASFAIAYEAFVLLLPHLGRIVGIGDFVNMNLLHHAYTLPFTFRNPFGAFISLVGSIIPVTILMNLLGFMLAIRFLPRKYVLVGMIFLIAVFQILFGIVREGAVVSICIRDFGWALIAALVLYYFDILAFLSLVVVEAFVSAIGLFDLSTPLGIILNASPLLVLLEAVIAYQNVAESVSGTDYKPEFVSLLEENERLHQEIAAAKSVQQKLLPRALPTHERVVVSATCVPAFEVGGDYYDFFALDERRLGVLIGDVSGKGISAAFYITLAKGVIVSQVRGSGSPSEVMHRVNALLYGVMERGKFVSMIYGIYDTVTREFSFANAGHNPLVVRRSGGSTELISSKGMAIGLDKGERFEKAVITSNITLEAQDCVLLYTDGVTEAMNTSNEEFGEDRMLESVRSSPLQPAEIISRTLYDVRRFVGKAHQHDDITLVALQAL